MIDTSLTEEQTQARMGRLTASRIADATTKTTTGKWGASRANYMADLIAERLTGIPTTRFVSKEMLWGIETEPQAKAAYTILHDRVEPVSFIEHPTIAMSGATPDGAVGDVGLVEFKCPNTATHIDFLLTDEVDLKYRKQMQWQLACSGRQWVDYGSFDPRMPMELQLRVRRFQRDEKMIAELEAQAREFLAELDAKVAALNTQLREEAA